MKKVLENTVIADSGDISLLDGRVYATLNKKEKAAVAFYIQRGRKEGISISVGDLSNPDALGLEELARDTNARVFIKDDHKTD